MTKVIGFNKKIAHKFKSCAEWVKEPLFTCACQKAADTLDVNIETLLTKRQASKFIRGTGIVYNTTIGAKEE